MRVGHDGGTEKRPSRQSLKKAGLITALSFSGFGTYSDNVMIPLLNQICTEFTGISLFWQNFIISGSAVFSVLAAFLSGILMRYISKKSLLAVGTVMFICGGVGGFFATDIWFLALTRAVDAASDGLLVSVATSLVMELFRDSGERGKVMGYSNAASSVYGILISFFAGMIGLFHWRYAFLLNGSSVITLFLILAFVPGTPPRYVKKQKNGSAARKGGSPRYRRIIVFDLLSLLLMGSFGCQIYFLLDLFIAEQNLGNSLLSGTLTSLSTAATVVTVLIFPRIYERTKPYTILLLYGVSAASLLLFAAGNGSAVLVMGTILAGFSIGASVIYFPLHLGEVVPEGIVETCISVVTAFQYVYMFLGPYVPAAVGVLTGDGSIRNSFFYTGLLLAVIMVLCAGMICRGGKKRK